MFINVEILAKTCEGKYFLKHVDPWKGLNLNVLQSAEQDVFAKENNSKLHGVVFELILTFLLPIECHFNL